MRTPKSLNWIDTRTLINLKFTFNFGRNIAMLKGISIQIVLVLFIGVVTMITSNANADSKFESWVQSFWTQAKRAGISSELYKEAFKGVVPDPEVLESARKQPEFVTPIWEYLDVRVSDSRIKNGKKKIKEWVDLINDIELKYGVDKHIFIAIWGMESAYGVVLDNPKIVKNNIRSLATLAFADRRRSKYARTQLLECLKIIQNGDVELVNMTGSWAGAMGHTQFIPTTYQAYAVDFDGDGRRDIWNSIPDALASTASYLKKSGWKTGKSWGYEVVLPENFDYGLLEASTEFSISKWLSLGIKRASGDEFPSVNDKARIYAPAGARGPAFILLKNFRVLKRYNNADTYALSVGHLADRLSGHKEFVQAWSKDYRPLSRSEIKTLQIQLNKKGFGAGPVDGKAGPGTRRAIRAYQKSTGLVADGLPVADLF